MMTSPSKRERLPINDGNAARRSKPKHSDLRSHDRTGDSSLDTFMAASKPQRKHRLSPLKPSRGTDQESTFYKQRQNKSLISLSKIFTKTDRVDRQQEIKDDMVLDQENRAPIETPIWAQFAQSQVHKPAKQLTNAMTNTNCSSDGKSDPDSCQPLDVGFARKASSLSSNQDDTMYQSELSSRQRLTQSPRKTALDRGSSPPKRPQSTIADAHSCLPDKKRHVTEKYLPKLTLGKRASKSCTVSSGEPGISLATGATAINTESSGTDKSTIDSAFETLLTARNVPHNTREKMRGLDTTIKANFIKQNGSANGSASSIESIESQPDKANHVQVRSFTQQQGQPNQVSNSSLTPRTRSRTFTITRATKPDPSPKKQKSSKSRSRSRALSGPLRRCTSTDSLASLTNGRPGVSSSSGKNTSSFATPTECVAYLENIQEPQAVEVGKIHKLRQLLRNETIEWVQAFIKTGGMMEICGLLYRIMDMEWREEHEDTLLHETLACLKALSTTSLALEQLGDISNVLFTRLLALLFSKEKKGPSEFATRAIIISLLSTFLSDGSKTLIEDRAQKLLQFLRDEPLPTSSKSLTFIESMHVPRPYRVWCKEVQSVTKEVFWIYLHYANVIQEPQYCFFEPEHGQHDSTKSTSRFDPSAEYLHRHFPIPHPPVPAAPYVGCVEWEATQYIVSHLDLMNGIIASLPTREARNALRRELYDSGFEKVMGSSLRTCNEKYHPNIHLALSTWVGAASEDEWNVLGVKEGKDLGGLTAPSSPVKQRKITKAPVLEMPDFDFGDGIGLDVADGT